MAKIITLCAFIFSLMLPFHSEAQQPDFNALMEQQGLYYEMHQAQNFVG